MPADTSRNIVLFASGSGSNVENIADYFQDSGVRVRGVICNNFGAGVIERCRRLRIPVYCCNRAAFEEVSGLLALLASWQPDLLVLAGFLWKVPAGLIAAYPDRIINIHPALLPKYGGKGMYGMRVHESVVAAGERESGITIHYVNEAYDEGAVIFQARVALAPADRPEEVASKVHALEYEHYPKVIESLLGKLPHGHQE